MQSNCRKENLHDPSINCALTARGCKMQPLGSAANHLEDVPPRILEFEPHERQGAEPIGQTPRIPSFCWPRPPRSRVKSSNNFQVHANAIIASTQDILFPIDPIVTLEKRDNSIHCAIGITMATLMDPSDHGRVHLGVMDHRFLAALRPLHAVL